MRFTPFCSGDLGIEVQSNITIEDEQLHTVVAMLFKHGDSWHVFDIVCGGYPRVCGDQADALNEMIEIAQREETASSRPE